MLFNFKLAGLVGSSLECACSMGSTADNYLAGKLSYFGFMHHWVAFIEVNGALPPAPHPCFNVTSLCWVLLKHVLLYSWPVYQTARVQFLGILFLHESILQLAIKVSESKFSVSNSVTAQGWVNNAIIIYISLSHNIRLLAYWCHNSLNKHCFLNFSFAGMFIISDLENPVKSHYKIFVVRS